LGIGHFTILKRNKIDQGQFSFFFPILVDSYFLIKMKFTLIQGIFLFGIILLLHLPFIEADPDYNISWSRGPFSDEGLYSEQIRDYIHHNKINFRQSDALLKTPLLSLIFYIPYLLLGTHLWVGRIIVLLISIIILFYCHRKFNIPYLIPVFFLCIMMEYFIFHHTHFALAEIISSSFLLLSLCFYNSFIRENSISKKWQKIFLSITFLTMAWLTKIQFIYLTPLIPAAYGGYLIINIKKTGKQELIFMCSTVLITFLYIGIYYLGWIVPNLEFINYIRTLAAGQFTLDPYTGDLMKYNLETIFFGKEMEIFTIAFILSFLTGIVILFRTSEKWFVALFIFAFICVLLESHKLTMRYLPSRYLISTYFAMGLLISLVITYLLIKLKGLKLIIPYSAIVILLYFNCIDYFKAFQNRHYVISNMNEYLSRYNFGNSPVIGQWAATCNWESGAMTIPILQNDPNYKDPITSHKPAMVISEVDEMESDYAYKNQQIDLASISDSVKKFQLSVWQIHFYWIKKQRQKMK
jgi:hypothetical protein